MRGYSLLEILFTISILGIIAALAIPSLTSARRAANESSASQSLRTVAFGEIEFRTADRDGNGIQDYWTGDVSGLYRIRGAAGTPIAVIELAVAGQDALPLPEHAAGGILGPSLNAVSAKAGYWILSMTRDEAANADYTVITDPGSGAVHHRDRFGFVAYPETYPYAGGRVFIVNESGRMLSRDPGGDIVIPGSFPPQAAPNWREFPSTPHLEGWRRLD